MNQGNSRTVSSNQTGVHPDLSVLLERHCTKPWRRPVARHSLEIFEQALPQLQQAADGLILDAGCGTGDSSRHLAGQYPDSLIVAVDQSGHRLQRQRSLPEPDNLLLLRADLQDFWRLLHDGGFRLQRHFLFYPNPWPKKRHIQRRWHGHPVLPWLLALGGVLEVRSNWLVYVEEFAFVLNKLGVEACKEPVQAPGVSPFERKYALSGQTLYRLQADLRAAAIPVPGPRVFPVADHTTG